MTLLETHRRVSVQQINNHFAKVKPPLFNVYGPVLIKLLTTVIETKIFKSFKK